MAEERQSDRRTHWKALIEEQESSGLSQRKFCEEREIALSQFTYYRGVFKSARPSKLATHAFAPITLTKAESSSLTDIRLILPNGFQCVFSSHLDSAKVKQLVETLLTC